MDRMLYIAMSGAKQTMLATAVNNNNLANVSTTGFRADLAQFRSMPVYGPGHPTRVYAMTERSGTDFSQGALNQTGNELDVAINGDGFIAVQAADGREAYTRAGNLRLTSDGLLLTGSGQPVIGDGGPITIPPAGKIDIASDGTISIRPIDGGQAQPEVIDRIKLVRPAVNELQKGEDGLIRLKSGEEAIADADVKLIAGSLESSNVNIAETLVNMIDLARQFEMQVKLMKDAETNADATRQLLQLA
jgi:flagellar basal-body rod protein FlgF